MSRKYFGTDGVRGRVGQYPITPDFVLRLGYAAGKVLLKHSPNGSHPSVLIGKDTRVSGYMIEAALEAGLSAAGVDVMLAGPMPTPAVAYLTRALRLSAGIVVSASHNPYDDNGIKFFSAAGTKLPDEVELEIEAYLDQPMGCADSDHLGKAKRLDDAAGRYIEFCKSTFPNKLDLKGLKIVVDAAHGAGYHIAPHVFSELGAEVHAIGVQPNGFNINDHVGATHTEALEVAVRANHADLGIALDGDGDRLIMVDGDGKRFDGDQLLYAMVKERKASEHVGGKVDGVVGTLMSNLALEHQLGKLGIPFERAKVGDRYVMEKLLEKGWVLGGENSGHLICLDRHTTGDALVAALQVLIGVRRTGLSLGELTKELVLYPQKLVNVRIEKGADWQNNAALKAATAEAEKELGEHGRVLIRASGTEPLVRVMVECPESEQATRLANAIAETLR
ncbi:phosphoglucosamine mutase [Parvibium lacunae]|uniref:Phosphoglucosamine mutase n=1 Tax=Parvibium lacunae TaxID=1888893 RepID=A0A368L6Q1_9BURK|nr:phosphoglucosamine mutase [Parvibium lacunae]RCS59306.1 phosphoglucosamine mutase [Parvibium lacunae]